MKYTVRLARDLSEYCDVEVEAQTEEEAEEKALDRVDDPDLPALQWELGTDREDTYAADVWESENG